MVTFLVTPEQAETLALASQQGSLQLALRNMMDTYDGEDVRHPDERAARGAPSDGRWRARPIVDAHGAGTRRGRGAPAEPDVIEVYRGGARTLQKF